MLVYASVKAYRGADFFLAVFLSFLIDSTLILDNSSDVKQVVEAASVYKLVLYLPMEYFSKSSRTDLVRRALRVDVLLSSGTSKADVDNLRLSTILRVFLKRIFVYTGHVEPSVSISDMWKPLLMVLGRF